MLEKEMRKEGDIRKAKAAEMTKTN